MRGWYVIGDGRDMEENGAMPDFVVMQTPEDEAKALDAQLAKAVEELVKKYYGKPINFVLHRNSSLGLE